MKNLNICIAGLGNVGSAVVSVIEKNSQYIKNKSNLTINIKPDTRAPDFFINSAAATAVPPVANKSS